MEPAYIIAIAVFKSVSGLSMVTLNWRAMENQRDERRTIIWDCGKRG
jgi:hypothetical protein